MRHRFCTAGFIGQLALAFFVTLAPSPSDATPDAFAVPVFSAPVVDQAGLLSDSERSNLNQALLQFHQRGGSQLAVLIVPTLGELSIEEASIKVVDQWKLGSKERDNGVLLFVAQQQRRLRIEVGQGLEGALPDAYARRIIDDVITPLLRSGRFAEGLSAGLVAMAKRTDPAIDLAQLLQLPPSSKQHLRAMDDPFEKFAHLLPLIILVLVFLFNSRRNRRRGYRDDRWFGGPFGGFGGGGFGGGGGGFGGGGGGGFSGGGSSGSW